MYMYENSSVSTDKQYLAALYLKSVTAARTRMNFLWHTLEPEIAAVLQEGSGLQLQGCIINCSPWYVYMYVNVYTYTYIRICRSIAGGTPACRSIAGGHAWDTSCRSALLIAAPGICIMYLNVYIHICRSIVGGTPAAEVSQEGSLRTPAA